MVLFRLPPAHSRVGNRRGYRLLRLDGLGYHGMRLNLNSGGRGRSGRLRSALYFDIQNRSQGANQNQNRSLNDLHRDIPLLF